MLPDHSVSRVAREGIVQKTQPDVGGQPLNETLLATLPEVLNLAETRRPLPLKRPGKSVSASRWLVEVREGLQEIPPRQPREYGRGISQHVQEMLDKGVGEGNRNTTAFYLACYLSAKGYDYGEVDDLIRQFAQQCQPPLSEAEIRSVIGSALKRAA